MENQDKLELQDLKVRKDPMDSQVHQEPLVCQVLPEDQEPKDVLVPRVQL